MSDESAFIIDIKSSDLAQLKEMRSQLTEIGKAAGLSAQGLNALESALNRAIAAMTVSVKSPFTALASQVKEAKIQMKAYNEEVQKTARASEKALNSGLAKTISDTKALVVLEGQLNAAMEKQAGIKASIAKIVPTDSQAKLTSDISRINEKNAALKMQLLLLERTAKASGVSITGANETKLTKAEANFALVDKYRQSIQELGAAGLISAKDMAALDTALTKVETRMLKGAGSAASGRGLQKVGLGIASAEAVQAELNKLEKAYEEALVMNEKYNAKIAKNQAALKASLTQGDYQKAINIEQKAFDDIEKYSAQITKMGKTGLLTAKELKVLEAELYELALMNSDLLRGGAIDLNKLSGIGASVNAIDKATAGTERLAKANRVLHDALRGVSGAAGTLWMTYGSMVPLMTGFAAAAAAIKSVKLGAEFEYTTKYTQAIAEATGGATAGLHQLQIELMGIEGLTDSPLKLAESVKELVKAGFDEATALGEVGELSKTATVAQEDLLLVTQSVASQFRAWNEETIGATRGVGSLSEVSNMMAYAAQATATDFGSLAENMKHTSGMAKTTGISFAELLASLGTLSNAGIKGTTAATSLRSAFAKLQSQTGPLKEQLEGLSTPFSAFTDTGGLKNATQMFKDLGASLADMTEEARVELLNDIFQLRGMEGGTEMLSQLSKSAKEGGFNFERLRDDIEKAGVELKFVGTVFEDLSSTSKIQMDMMMVNVEKALIRAFDDEPVKNLIAVINTAANDGSLQTLINSIVGVSDAFMKAAAAAIKFKEITIAGFAAYALVNLTAAIKGVTTAQLLFNAAVKANPYILIGTAVISAGALAYAALSESMSEAVAAAKLTGAEMDSVSKAIKDVGGEADDVKIAVENLRNTVDAPPPTDGFVYWLKNIFNSDMETAANDFNAELERSAQLTAALAEEVEKAERKAEIRRNRRTVDAKHGSTVAQTEIIDSGLSSSLWSDKVKAQQALNDAEEAARVTRLNNEAEVQINTQRLQAEEEISIKRNLQEEIDRLNDQILASNLAVIDAKIDAATLELYEQKGNPAAAVKTKEELKSLSDKREELEKQAETAKTISKIKLEGIVIPKAVAKSNRDATKELEAYEAELRSVKAAVEDIPTEVPAGLSAVGDIVDKNAIALKEFTEATKKKAAAVDDDALTQEAANALIAEAAEKYKQLTDAQIESLATETALGLAREAGEASRAAQLDDLQGMAKLYQQYNNKIEDFTKSEKYLILVEADKTTTEKRADKALADYTETTKESVYTTEARIAALKEEDTVLEGVTAAVLELQKNYKTLGSVGYDAFNSVSEGFNDSISTSLKYFVHGLDDAKEALQETRDESLAAALKTYDEELAALEESYAAGETEFEDYEEEKTELYKNYMEQRQDVLTEYNENVAEAERQLGTDLEDIWDGVLDSMLDSFSDWIGDLAMKWAASSIVDGLGLDIDVNGLMGGGPSGYANDPVYVAMTGSTGTGTTASSIGSGDLTDSLGSASALSTDFTSGSGWDAVATSMADSVETALDSGVTLTITDDMGLQESMDALSLSADSFYNSLDAAVDAFGTTTDAWEQAAVDFWSSDVATDAWAGQLDKINLSDMLTDDESTSTLSSTLTTLKPYLQAAGGALSAYSAYNQFSQGNYLGGSISAMGSASSLYQAGANAGWYTMSTMGQGLVGAAGVVGGGYGLYSGISDMLKNGLTLTNGLSTALSTYTTYTSAAALYAAATGETLAAGSTLFAGLEGIGASITGSLATAAETIGITVAKTATTTAAATSATVTAETTAATTGAAAGAGGGLAAGLAAGGLAAAVAATAYGIYTGFISDEGEDIINTSVSTALGDWELSMKEKYYWDGMQSAGHSQQYGDAQTNLISGDVSALVDDFRKSISYLGNEWGDEFSVLAAGLEDSSISAEGFIETVASLWDEQISLTTAQVEQIESLTEQAAAGSAQAAGELEIYLSDLGLAADLSASAAAALVSGADALATGYETAIEGADELAEELYGMARASQKAEASVDSIFDYLQDRAGDTGKTPTDWYATGGVIGGVLQGGSGRVDDLYLGTIGGRAQVAMGGEYIMPQEQTEKYKPILDLMRADKYAAGGATPSVRPGVIWQPPAVDAVQSDLGSLMQGIYNTINATKDYAKSVQDVRADYADAYAEAQELGASESQLRDIRIAQYVALKDLAAEQVAKVNDFLEPYRRLNRGMSETQVWVADLTAEYEDAIATAKDLGMSESQLNEIRAAQGVELQNEIDSIMEGVRDTLAEDRLSSFDYEALQINEKFDEMRESLVALGASTSDLTLLEQARNIELKEATGLQPLDYYQELQAMGATVSTFGSQAAFTNLNSAEPAQTPNVEVTVLLDGNGIINNAVLDSRILEVSDTNSYDRSRRGFTGQSTYPQGL